MNKQKDFKEEKPLENNVEEIIVPVEPTEPIE